MSIEGRYEELVGKFTGNDAAVHEMAYMIALLEWEVADLKYDLRDSQNEAACYFRAIHAGDN